MSQLPFDDIKIVSGDRRAQSHQFFVICTPPRANHQRKKIITVKAGPKSFAKLADSDELKEAWDSWKTLLLPHQPRAPMPGPVALRLEFTWPWRNGESKKVRALGRIPKATAPDCSNMAKTVEDVLALMRFIENDAEVAELVVRKFYGDKPGLAVRIAPIEDGEEDL